MQNVFNKNGNVAGNIEPKVVWAKLLLTTAEIKQNKRQQQRGCRQRSLSFCSCLFVCFLLFHMHFVRLLLLLLLLVFVTFSTFYVHIFIFSPAVNAFDSLFLIRSFHSSYYYFFFSLTNVYIPLEMEWMYSWE